MDNRTMRENVLRAKLKMIAKKMGIDEDTIIQNAQSLGMFRDAREAANEYIITINQSSVTAEDVRLIVEQVTKNEVRRS